MINKIKIEKQLKVISIFIYYFDNNQKKLPV